MEHKMNILLDSKYDIDMEQYWTLTEEDKNDLVNIIVEEIHKGIKNTNDIPYHLSQMDYRRMESEHQDEFERADMIKRIMNKTKEIFT